MIKKTLAALLAAAILVPGPAVTSAFAQQVRPNMGTIPQGYGADGALTTDGSPAGSAAPAAQLDSLGGSGQGSLGGLDSLNLSDEKSASRSSVSSPSRRVGTSAPSAVPVQPYGGNEAAPGASFGRVSDEGSRAAGVASESKRSKDLSRSVQAIGSESAFMEAGRLFDAMGAKSAAAPEARASASSQISAGRELPSLTIQGREAAPSKGALTSVVGLHAAPEDGQQPPSQPQQPSDSGAKKFFTGPVIAFLTGLVVTQIGTEFLGQSMPQLVRSEFGGFKAMAQLAIFSSVARIFGSAIGGAMSEQQGEKKVYIGADVAKAVSIGIMVTLLVTHHMTMPMMMAFYSLNGLFTGVGMTAEKTIPSKIVGQDQTRLEKYWGVNQFVLETIGVSAPIVAGMLIAATGTFSYAVAVYPAAVIAAALILWKFLKLPEAPKDLTREASQKSAPAKKSIGDRFKEIFTKIGDGAKIVWKNPALRVAFFAYTAYMLVNPLLYSVIAPAYGQFVVGGVAAKAASVQSWVVGMYSLGGLAGAYLMMREGKKVEKAPEDRREAMAKASTLKWMAIGVASLAGFVPMMWSSTLVMTLPGLSFLAGMPVLGALSGPFVFPAAQTLTYASMFLFGLGSVVPTIKLQSLVQSMAPQDGVAKVMGFVQAASILVSTSGLYALGRLFDALPADVIHAGGFSIWKAGAFLNAGFLVLALGYVGLRMMLKGKMSAKK